jgi:hypothetical protein
MHLTKIILFPAFVSDPGDAPRRTYYLGQKHNFHAAREMALTQINRPERFERYFCAVRRRAGLIHKSYPLICGQGRSWVPQ